MIAPLEIVPVLVIALAPIARVPVSVPPARGSFAAIEFVTVVEKLASSPSAAANSLSVFNVPGAESTIKATRASARASV